MTTNDTLSQLKEKEREVRRGLIIDAARTLFGIRTYDAVSMAEIARTAGIAKSSIYTYFPSQEALFVEVVARDSERCILKMAETIRIGGQRALPHVIHYFLDYYFDNEAEWRMITRFALHGDISTAASQRLDLVARRLMDLLEQAVTSAAPGHTEARLLSHTLFSALSGILISFRKYPGRSETARRQHIKRIGETVERILMTYLCGPSQDEAP
ncbi:MAG: TetR/AcrR family transcriptional regulator [Pseudomonadota bacterium]